MNIYPSPDVTETPFVPPIGATFNGGPVPTSDYNLFCSMDEAQTLIEQYAQALSLQGLTGSFTVSDGIASGVYGQFMPAADGSTIPIIVGTVTDAQGNTYSVSDPAGLRIYCYLNPFVPGQITYGDKNYKEVIPINSNGQPDPANTKDVAVPGYLVLKDMGFGLMQGIWVSA